MIAVSEAFPMCGASSRVKKMFSASDWYHFQKVRGTNLDFVGGHERQSLNSKHCESSPLPAASCQVLRPI